MTYSYSKQQQEEILPGPRSIVVTASDGQHSPPSSLLLRLEVAILNDNPPLLALGITTATFLEGSTQPLGVGEIYRPSVSDADNNTVFLMEEASVFISGGRTEADRLAVSPNATSQLRDLGIDFKGTCTYM